MYVLITRIVGNDTPHLVTHLPSGTVREAWTVIHALYRGVRDFQKWGQFTALDPDLNRDRFTFVFDICAIDPLPRNLLRD